MNTNIIQELKTNSPRDKVMSPRGELPIKEYTNGGKYVNYKGQKISLGLIPVEQIDIVFNYVFNLGFEKNNRPDIEKYINKLIFVNKKQRCN